MSIELLKRRTQSFAIEVIRFVATLPCTFVAQEIGRQLTRSGTSVGANYRAACRAKSRADFIAKMKIVEEECDESVCWMELLNGIGMDQSGRILPLKDEAIEILSIMVASIKTARSFV